MPQISKGQLAVLLINILIPTAHIQVLLTTTKYSKYNALLATVLSYLIAIMITFFCLKLTKRYPNDNILKFSPKLLGPILGKLIIMVLFLYSFLISTYTLEQFTILLTNMIYRNVSPYLFRIAFMILIVYVTSLGIEVLFRVNDIIFLGVIIVIIIIGIGLVQHVDFNLLRPIFNYDFLNLFKGSLIPTAFFGEFILILFFNNLINDLTGLEKVVNFSLFIGLVLVGGFVITNIVIYGVDLGARLWFPPYMLTRFVKVGDFFNRLEILLLFVWIALIFIKLAIFFWMSKSCLVSLFNLKNKGIINLPLAVTIIALVGGTWNGVVDFQSYVEVIYSTIILVIESFLPLLLYLIALIRGKKGVTNE